MRRRQGSYAVQAAGKLPHILVVMVTIKQSAILVCASLALSISSLAMAADSTVHVNGSRGMTVSSGYSPAINYTLESVDNSPLQRYVAAVQMDDFLMCNEFADQDDPSNTNLYLRPVHGAWLIGSMDSQGLSGSFTRISDINYAGGQLNVTACSATGTGTGCGGAALQCFTADAHGGSVADTRRLFATGFDEYTNTGNSFVYITVEHVPAGVGDKFKYTIHYTAPPAGTSGLTSGTNSTQSLYSNTYVLTEGYDKAVFSHCDISLGTEPQQVGTPIGAGETGTISRSCWMINPGSAFPGDVPVVSAALFTSPDVANESTYSDNVAFGYPVLSTP